MLSVNAQMVPICVGLYAMNMHRIIKDFTKYTNR